MTPIEKLDIVLKFLATSPKALPRITDADILSILSELYPELKKENDFGSQLIRILNKLYKEDYVNFNEKTTGKKDFQGNEHIIKLWSISFDGYYFITEKGGYSEQHRLEVEQNLSLKIENRAKKRNEILLILGTWLAGFGACALVIWEIIKQFLLGCK